MTDSKVKTRKNIENKSHHTTYDDKHPLAIVAERYCQAGWSVVYPPIGSINDLIAQRGKKLHFIQINTPENVTSCKFQDIPKNTFIQNAFSNGAVPVYAHITVTRAKSKLAFEDANQNSRIIISGSTRSPPGMKKESPKK